MKGERMTRYVLGLLSVVLGFASEAATAPADLVLVHGKVHTEDANRSVVQALAVRGNSIVAVGTDEAISAHVGQNTRTLHLGRPVGVPRIIHTPTPTVPNAPGPR